MSEKFAGLQSFGRALMLPIAVLPVAGLLLRLGQPDLLDVPLLAAAGDALFSQLGLIFAVGVAVGFARDNHGAAGLAGTVGFLVASHGAAAILSLPPTLPAGLAAESWRLQQVAKFSVPLGILSGLIAGYAHNRFGDIRLPPYLAFFAGRRFVPIVTGFAGIALGGLVGVAWPVLAQGMDALSRTVLNSGAAGLFLYGVLNRVLLITGLHHILNNIAWFLIGDYHGVTGDLKRFFAGDPSAGAFMTGFFPITMFGLPGACLAMYHSVEPSRRRAAAGLLASIALTSFLTGVTEPVEFTFMFVAPVLYGLHALLTGAAMVLMQGLGVRLGFGFSAGLFDYALNFSRATRPWLLLPVGAATFGLYYALFRYAIARLDLPTPGRDREWAGEARAIPAAPGRHPAAAFIEALGGAGNLRTVDACTTRLRLAVADVTRVDDAALARLGALGVLRPSGQSVQVVLGPVADQVAGDIRAALLKSPAHESPVTPAAVLAALGGQGNLRSVTARPGRVLVAVREAATVDIGALRAAGVRDAVVLHAGAVHLLVADAEELARRITPPTGAR